MKTIIKALTGRLPISAGGNIKSAVPLVALQMPNRAHWTPRQSSALIREGYRRNPIAYRCVRLIAESAATVPLRNENPHDNGSVDELAGRLLRRSPLGEPISDMMERFFGDLQVFGNAYLELILVDQVPRALAVISPEKVTLKRNRSGQVLAYEIDTGQGLRQVCRDVASGRCALFHMALLSPGGDGTGFAPLAAAAQAVDIHNEGSLWTKALLDNSARPSGALVLNKPAGADHLTSDQFYRLKDELEAAYSGAQAAGRPMVLEGGLDWKPMGLSPADMDFLQARREAAREIALAFGIPPMVLGIPGDNTYANYREANQALWRQTIIPLVAKTAHGLTHWLAPYLGDELKIRPDLDTVPALSEERSALWARLSGANFLSDDERRQMAGIQNDITHG